MHYKILILDEAPDTRSSVRIILNMEGFNVETAKNEKDCFAKIASGFIPDLLITDLFMNGGLEICAKLRQHYPKKQLKIICLSARQPSSYDKEALSGFFISSYITKPFDLNELVNAVKEAISKNNF